MALFDGDADLDTPPRWDELDTSSTGSASSSSLLSGWGEDEARASEPVTERAVGGTSRSDLALESESFNAHAFLATHMGSLALDELEDEVGAMRDELDVKTSRVHGLTKKNFRRFNNCYDGVLMLARKLAQRGATSSAVEIQRVVAELTTRMTSAYGDMLARTQEIKRRRTVLGVLARVQQSLVSPGTMRDNLARRKVRLVVRDYQKAMALLASQGDAHLILWQLYADVESIAASARQELFTALETPTLSLATTRALISLLAGLNTRESGTAFALGFRIKRLLKLVDEAKERHTARLAAPRSAVPDRWLHARASGGDAGEASGGWWDDDSNASSDGEGTGAGAGAGAGADLRARGGQDARSVGQGAAEAELEELASQAELESEAWSETFQQSGLVFSGSLASAEPAMTREQLARLRYMFELVHLAVELVPECWELGGAELAGPALAPVLERLCARMSEAFFGSGEAARSREHASVERLMQPALRALALCYRTLVERGVAADALRPLLHTLDETSQFVVSTSCAHMLGRIGALGARGGISVAPPQLLADFLLVVRVHCAQLAAIVPGELALAASVADALFEAMRMLLDSVHAIVFESGAGRGAASLPPPETRRTLLQCLALLDVCQSGALNSLAEHVYMLFGWRSEDARGPLREIRSLVVMLRELVVARYVRWHAARLHPLITDGILSTGADLLRGTDVVVGVRAYAMEALLVLVLVHSEVFACAPMFVPSVLVACADDLANSLLHAVRELPRLGEPALAQLLVDIEFCDLVLAPFSSDVSSEAFEAATAVVTARLAKGAVSPATRQRVKGLVSEALNATAVQFACFADGAS